MSVLARMVAASVSQIRANDVTNPLCRWLYNMLWIATVTVQLFWRSIGSVGQALAVATRNRPCTLQNLKKPGVHCPRYAIGAGFQIAKISKPINALA
ncbi:hypothetical protein I5W36_16070 [Stenotrophomonas maltophilia]|uniref:hypothetical protein n=1 Tax=Stenotrophomonas TaxID=40323 RepID=UPI0018AD397F|nr:MULTISPECIES: hypothetical protein [unclassified Stenotrophomonas]MBF9139262.1 hypothetical protein [Stenotrophomonas sp. 232]MBH1778133.1 hypothetical protein [Stenotrophomonas maltophilia]MBN4972934.1 hypothetical protein [Stenotrophomonas maltophilia]MDG9761747.1 hypothetical protein [Stenotrophomonas sp. GD04064]